MRTTDLGGHWVDVAGLPPEANVQTVAIDALDQVFVGTSMGVYRSTDGGGVWTPEGLQDERILALGVDPGGFLFAQGIAGPVYRSVASTPVAISDLAGVQVGGDMVLSWRTIRSGEPVRFRVFRQGAGADSGRDPIEDPFAALVPDVDADGSGACLYRDVAPRPGRYRYRVAPVPTDGSLATGASVEVEVVRRVPLWSRLGPNSPNPFNPRTILHFKVASSRPVEVSIYDARGRLTRALWRAPSPRPGDHLADWDGRDDAGRSVPSGVYWARLAVGGRVVDARPLTLVR